MDRIKIYMKSILIPLILSTIIGLIIAPAMKNDTLIKPLLNPPNIVFPIVWTILYILMGISYGILKDKKLLNDNIRLIYYIQLGFNMLWPIFFFLLQWRLFAFIWLILLILLIIIMIKEFYNKNKKAGILQIPYLLWAIFASYLNLSIYLLNR